MAPVSKTFEKKAGVVILHIENKSAPLRGRKIINLPQNCAMNFQKFPYFKQKWANTSGADKLGRSYLLVSEAFKLISVHLDIFYLISLGLIQNSNDFKMG